jgi:uncharacterized protein (TIGR02118 family)
MTTKITIIYDNPTSPSTFESSFTEVQVAAAERLPGLERLEVSKVWPKEDGSPTPKYRMLDLYFSDYATASRVLETTEAAEMFEAVTVAATGGVIFLFSKIER